MELNRAKYFFNHYQFGAALTNFKYARDKLIEKSLHLEVAFYLKLANFYDIWDKFNDKIVVEEENNVKTLLNDYLKDLLSEIKENNKIYEKIQKDNPFLLMQIEYNKEFLDKKISKKNKNIGINIQFYLPDLLNNAKRRIDERKFDDAVARLYRAIELISQIKLNKLGLINNERLKINKVFHIDKAKFEDKLYKTLSISEAKSIFNTFSEKDYNSIDKPTFKLPLKSNYELLSEFDNTFAKNYLNNNALKSEVAKRNNSILAHGLEPIDYKTAINLFDLVLDYSKLLCPDIEEKYMKLAKFPKFKV
jgi:CRISPR-associated protein (TIGR02710 family)